MDKECSHLINEIKKTVPSVTNLASNVGMIEQFVNVQELILKLQGFGMEQNLDMIIQSFKDYFQPILLSTLSYEVDFIKVIEPVLRTPKLAIHASTVLGERTSLTPPFSYHSILNKLIKPTEIEKKIGEILFVTNSSRPKGLRQTQAIQIAISSTNR